MGCRTVVLSVNLPRARSLVRRVVEMDFGKYPVLEKPESGVIQYKGPDGGEFTWWSYEGHGTPLTEFTSLGVVPDIRDLAPKLKAMKCRNDDIFLCAFGKSGTHWVWEIANMLATGKHQYLTKVKEDAMFEFHYPEEFDNFPSPRILNTHLPFSFLPQEISDKRLPIIFVQRNPKDIMVSGYSHMKKMTPVDKQVTFRDHVSFFSKAPFWFDYTLQWEKVIEENPHLPIHVIYFENLKMKPEEEISRLAKFLGQNRDPEFIQKVAEMCKFTNLKKANEEVKDLSKFGMINELMTGMYRKGEVGDWRNWFTVAQSEEFDAVYNEKMKDSKFKFCFT